MSDVNARVATVDAAMDLMELYAADLSDLRAETSWALTSVISRLEQEYLCCRELSYRTEEGEQERLWEMQNALLPLSQWCRERGEALQQRWSLQCVQCDERADEALRETGLYMQKLNRMDSIVRRELAAVGAGGENSGVFVCVIDSRRYPQSAEHIKAAIDMGAPSLWTLDRPGAARRRKESMNGYAPSPIWDRDEIPCAMFAEGGAGSDVAYIEGRDNRGSGSFLSWQVRKLPDGTRVRIRII